MVLLEPGHQELNMVISISLFYFLLKSQVIGEGYFTSLREIWSQPIFGMLYFYTRVNGLNPGITCDSVV